MWSTLAVIAAFVVPGIFAGLVGTIVRLRIERKLRSRH